mgnify:CR=1 FL=1
MSAHASARWLVAYDIAEKRRLGRVFRLLKKHGVPVQYSVFLVPASAQQMDRLIGQLAPLIDPRDDAAIEELGKLTGHAIAPHAVSEARGLYYLERLYNLPRKARYIRAGTRRVLSAAVERRRTHPTGVAIPARIEPRRITGPVIIPPLPTPEPSITFGEAGERLVDATHRDQIAASRIVIVRRDTRRIGLRRASSEVVVGPSINFTVRRYQGNSVA